jgi:PHP family Zn ribbon phosphoesterase
MAHDIEAAKSGRSACATCGEKIAKGEVRVAELYQDATLGPVLPRALRTFY